MKKNNGFLRILLYTGLILIGVVLGITIRHYYSLPIAETLNIVDLATLVTTIFLAVYIPEVLDRKLQIKRDKKDLIEQRITELQALFRKINLLVQSEEELKHKDYLVIKNTLDLIGYKFDTIATLLDFANMDLPFNKEVRAIKTLCNEHRELLYAPQEKDGLFYYPDEVQKKEELLYSKIDKASCLLIFKVSEA